MLCVSISHISTAMSVLQQLDAQAGSCLAFRLCSSQLSQLLSQLRTTDNVPYCDVGFAVDIHSGLPCSGSELKLVS